MPIPTIALVLLSPPTNKPLLLTRNSPVTPAPPPTVKFVPSKVKLASPFKASLDEKVATLLSAPFATALTAPPPPPPILDDPLTVKSPEINTSPFLTYTPLSKNKFKVFAP